MMTTCLISLGGNLGDVAATIDRALRRLHQPPEVSVGLRSSLFHTKPVGAVAGADFVNAAAVLETSLTAHELLDRLLATETELDRVRTIHWGPRTLDLDLLFFGEAIIDDRPKLRVPHPACWYRRFVLDPLVEIAPQIIHPEKGVSIAELHRRLLARPLRVSLVGDSEELDRLVATVKPEFPDASLRWCRQPNEVPASDDGLLIQLLANESLDVTQSLSKRIGWLDASQHPGERRQCLVDILRSAGL